MRVSDLIEKLNEYDGEYEVFAIETGGIRIGGADVEQISIPYEDGGEFDDDETDDDE